MAAFFLSFAAAQSHPGRGTGTGGTVVSWV